MVDLLWLKKEVQRSAGAKARNLKSLKHASRLAGNSRRYLYLGGLILRPLGVFCSGDYYVSFPLAGEFQRLKVNRNLSASIDSEETPALENTVPRDGEPFR